MILTFKSVDKTVVCDHSNESCWAVLSRGTVYYAVQSGLTFESVDETRVCVLSDTFTWYQCSFRCL